MRIKNNKKIILFFTLICLCVSFLSTLRLSSATEWPYTLSIGSSTAIIFSPEIDNTGTNVASYAQQFSLDTNTVCDNITILMRNTGIPPYATFSMDIYLYNDDIELYTEGQNPLGTLIAQSTNYYGNNNFKVSNDHSNYYDIESWNLTTFLFDSISLNATEEYIFDVRYTGSQQIYGGLNVTSIAAWNAGYDWTQIHHWQHYSNYPSHANPFWVPVRGAYEIPWIMNQQRYTPDLGDTNNEQLPMNYFTFGSYSHGSVYYRVSQTNLFPSSTGFIDISSSGETVGFADNLYVWIYGVADEGYYFSGFDVSGIGNGLLSGYCVNTEENRTINALFTELPENMTSGTVRLIVSNNIGCGVDLNINGELYPCTLR